jgi:hypothetical protein
MGTNCVACGPWLTTPEQVTLAGRLALDGQTLYVGGAESTASGESSWIGTFDACTGHVELSTTYAGPVSPSIGDLPFAASSTRLFFAGEQDAQPPFLGSVPKTTGASWNAAIGSGTDDRIADLLVGSDGDLWAVGVTGSPATTWLVRERASGGTPCEYTDVNSVSAFGVAPSGGDGVLVGSIDASGDLVFVPYVDASCASHPACSCDPADSPTNVTIPLANPVPTQMLSFDGFVFVVGHGAATDGKQAGFVARITASDLTLADTFVFHPSDTAKDDALYGITDDGTNLLVVGGKGLDDAAAPAAGTAVILKLSPTFTTIFDAPTPSAAFFQSVQVSGTGIFVTGANGAGAVVARCDSTGVCG